MPILTTMAITLCNASSILPYVTDCYLQQVPKASMTACHSHAKEINSGEIFKRAWVAEDKIKVGDSVIAVPPVCLTLNVPEGGHPPRSWGRAEDIPNPTPAAEPALIVRTGETI